MKENILVIYRFFDKFSFGKYYTYDHNDTEYHFVISLRYTVPN